MEALNAYETMRAFMYAHINEIDQTNIVSVESLLFNLKRKGVTKHMKINDVFRKKQCKVIFTVDTVTLFA
jgi:flagellar biosynthesis/type III secretory pathway ATPase